MADIVERLQARFDHRIVQPDELARDAANEIIELRRRLYSCFRYFDHCQRTTLPNQACDSGEMAVRMALKQEATEAALAKVEEMK